MIRIIAAITLDRAIGVYPNGLNKKGKLPWEPEEAKSDLAYFKELTDKSKSCIIMGRKTFESINEKPLPGRYNFVISRKIKNDMTHEQGYEYQMQHHKVPPQWHTNMESAIHTANMLYGDGDYFPNALINIIGGKHIFSEGMKYASEILLTVLPIKAYERYNTSKLIYFPSIAKGFTRLPTEVHPKCSAYRIIRYVRC